MSSLAVMQPYFFPYIGYFQLLEAVDTFVFYDDVDFIKNGWINRNKILINGKAKYITIPCRNISSNRSIKSVNHALDQRLKKKLFKKIKFSYSSAPNFEKVFLLINRVLSHETDSIAELAIQSVIMTSEYLGIDCKFFKSSEKYNNSHLNAADRLIDICKKEEAKDYVNLIGGKELYDRKFFIEKGINLLFLEPNTDTYQQFNNEFVPWLSIIDVMMFNPPEKIKKNSLKLYNLK